MRVGGLVWEFRIFPKRLQERRRNEFEAEKARRNEKKENKNDNEATEGPKVTIHRPCR